MKDTARIPQMKINDAKMFQMAMSLALGCHLEMANPPPIRATT